MLSRFALKAASAVPQQQKVSILFRVMSSSTKPVEAAASSSAPVKKSEGGDKQIRRYPHDSPERDFVNYPPPTQREEGGKLRVGFLPEEWFQAFYNKTGVTGPYILFWGGLLTAISKEYYVSWIDTAHVLSTIALVMIVHKMYGHKIKASLEKKYQKAVADLKAGDEAHMKEVNENIATAELLKNLPEVNKFVHEAKRENVFLQLEAAYRARLAQVNAEVKKRLDYQVAVQGIYKRLEREQAIQYILSEVNKALGPAQEKEAFQSGVNQLKALSKKYAGAI